MSKWFILLKWFIYCHTAFYNLYVHAFPWYIWLLLVKYVYHYLRKSPLRINIFNRVNRSLCSITIWKLCIYVHTSKLKGDSVINIKHSLTSSFMSVFGKIEHRTDQYIPILISIILLTCTYICTHSIFRLIKKKKKNMLNGKTFDIELNPLRLYKKYSSTTHTTSSKINQVTYMHVVLSRFVLCTAQRAQRGTVELLLPAFLNFSLLIAYCIHRETINIFTQA